ncbi:hypothetical protein ON010_g646 [Phytophthora cinnamomi]|nr:hypothetical protein ON010_g646 [Phytophthora cinnamomi]
MISSLRMSSQEEPLGESSLNDFAGVDDWEPSLVVIESVTLPAHSIVKTKTGATSYTIEVQLRGGQEWVVEKRYSDLRRLHDRLKSIGAPVRHLRFPAKSYVRNLSASALERWRRELEAYLTELLGIRPVLRWELFNFLGVYVNVREFERLWRGLANEEIDGLVERRAEEFKRRRLSSEDGYFGETSPATNSVSSGSVQAQSDTDSLMVGSSTYLEDLVEMCRGMDELQGMCENMVERLLRTRNWLVEEDFRADSSRLTTAFAQIGHRFHAFLGQHSDRSTIKRLVSARTLMNILLEFNRDLDSVQRKLGFAEARWETTWDDVVQQVKENLVFTWKANVESLHTELAGAEAQRGALTLLKNEARYSELKRSASSQEILGAAAEIVQRMSDALVGAVPDRFIPEHEVQRESTPFFSGSYGTIFRGKWTGLNVVIKYVDVNSPDDMRAFLQEDKIWHMARHPNVVTVPMGPGHRPRPCFFVSEEAVNGNAVDFLAKRNQYGRSLVWRTMHGAALGLRFLHVNNIIHGDLKCNNIVVDASEVAKLTDFGMSFVNGSGSLTSVHGPARWTAPECLVRNQQPSFQSDRYSLGMCIVEAVTGKVPWGGRQN